MSLTKTTVNEFVENLELVKSATKDFTEGKSGLKYDLQFMIASPGHIGITDSEVYSRLEALIGAVRKFAGDDVIQWQIGLFVHNEVGKQFAEELNGRIESRESLKQSLKGNPSKLALLPE